MIKAQIQEAFPLICLLMLLRKPRLRKFFIFSNPWSIIKKFRSADQIFLIRNVHMTSKNDKFSILIYIFSPLNEEIEKGLKKIRKDFIFYF